MKSFIRRKSDYIKKAAFGSALFFVSAFAVFTSKADELQNDSILTARAVFEKIHCPALEILPPSTRLDMLDYWDVDSVYKASNDMEGLSWLDEVSLDYLKVHITSVSTLEIKILPANKGNIIMTVNTIGDEEQAQDSQVNFYDIDLKELPADKHLVIPAVKDFFELPKGSITKMKEIEQMIPFPTVAYSANSENNNLEARLTIEKYINEDDWNILKLFIKPNIILEWKKEKYKYIK